MNKLLSTLSNHQKNKKYLLNTIKKMPEDPNYNLLERERERESKIGEFIIFILTQTFLIFLTNLKLSKKFLLLKYV